ncbi:acyl carrier protein [bacterium]|nr:acyl carrier protein [bacterium]
MASCAGGGRPLGELQSSPLDGSGRSGGGSGWPVGLEGASGGSKGPTQKAGDPGDRGGGDLAGMVKGEKPGGRGKTVEIQAPALAAGVFAESSGGAVGDRGGCARSGGKPARPGGGRRRRPTDFKTVERARYLANFGGEAERGSSAGRGLVAMKTAGEFRDVVRKAVADTLRRKDPVLDGQRLMADLGAESIDRIDLVFRLEEAVQKALDEKVLFAEPEPTVVDLAERLQRMVEGK